MRHEGRETSSDRRREADDDDVDSEAGLQGQTRMDARRIPAAGVRAARLSLDRQTHRHRHTFDTL